MEAKKEIVTIVIIREECEVCEGTGLLKVKGRTIECHKCKGYGTNEVSKTKETRYE